MAREELSINVTAKDDASKVLDGVSKKAESLEDVKVKVSADTDAAERDIQGLLEKVDKLGAGQAANLMLTSNASQITQEMADLVIKLDTLDASDPQVDVTIANIGQLQGDLDSIAAKAKEINTTPINLDTTGATQSIKNIGDTADQSRSVLANMVGNSAQEIGALTGVAGPAGVALGQLGEYAADGNIKLGNLAAVAGPLVAVGVALQGITKHAKGVAETEAWDTGQIDDFTAAIREGEDAAKALADRLEAAGKVEFHLGDQAFEDVTKPLALAGLSVEQFSQLAVQGEDSWRKWGEGAKQAGVDAGYIEGAYLILDSYSQQYTKSQDAANYALKFFGETADQTAAKLDAATKTQEARSEKIGEEVQRVKDLQAAYDEAAEAMKGMEPDEGFDRVIDQLNKASELDFAAMALNTVESFDSIKGALKEAEEAGTDWADVDFSPESLGDLRGIPDELKAVTESVIGMRGTIQTELAAAFDTGGVQGFVDKAGFFAQQITDQFLPIFEKMTGDAGLAQDKVNELLTELGLMPEQVQVQIELTRQEQAMAALETFRGVIEKLPLAKQIAINTAIAEGDIQAALDLLNNELRAQGEKPIVLPIDADIAAAEEKIGYTVALADGSTGTVTIAGNADPAMGEVEGVVTYADGSTGTVTVEGNPDPGKGQVDAVVRFADGSTGMVTINADTKPAQNQVATFPIPSRTMTIYAQMAGIPAYAGPGQLPGGRSVAATATATTAAAPASYAPAPIYINVPAPAVPPITINAGVIGNRFEIDRTVTKALRRFQRLNGRRA
jgi:hypothetical protein